MQFDVTVAADLSARDMVAAVGRGFREAVDGLPPRELRRFRDSKARAALESIASDGNGQLTFTYSIKEK